MITQTYIARHVVAQNSYQRTLHFHDINEILFSLNDGCTFFLGGQVYNIRRGVLILIPEGVIHRKFNPDNQEILVDTYTLHFPLALLEAYSTPRTDFVRIYGNSAACIQIPEHMIQHTVELFEKCLQESDGTFGSDVARNQHFLNILLEVYPFLAKSMENEKPHSITSPLISDMIRYISSHLASHISLDQLSGEFFVSKYNLCRQFKQETGFTIIEYINSCRIQMACRILREEKQLTNLAVRVGFPSQSHFIHIFRRYTGVTPREYLERCKQFAEVPVHSNFSPPGA
ncbi:AraC family transcriptional regulator [Flavonifractor sp. AGMB03687]|uniref:helix-turn-helix transcriptional regulator n=1 Tax=Flavonifractor sp. AGMB03687 TaxID=2785133 RepID=UPI001AE0C849|nr:AraC family transcriptional regulator [Flavonifractor sp. AGMB03687]